MTKFPLGNESIPKDEEKILKFWKEKDIFAKTIKSREKNPEFRFFDGPPFATGTPHYGHILAGTIKDSIPRYWTMKGYKVDRKWGWDCHGLPVEFQVEKEHKISGKEGIKKMGIGKFNELCRSIVMRCASQWEDTVDRMGRFVDFKNDYKTMNPEFMESVWWVFGELWKKGLIYEGKKVISYSPKLASSLSNFEANLNYQDVDDPALTVKFKLKKEEKTYILAWTTTPWTLPLNLGLCVNPKLNYQKISNGNENYIVVENFAKKLLEKNKDWQVVENLAGKNLVGKEYEPLFPLFENHENAFQVFADDFVSENSGTGIVHMAPTGEDDARILQDNNIQIFYPMTDHCYFDFTEVEVAKNGEKIAKELSGKYFRDDKEVVGSKENNVNDWVLQNLDDKLFSREQIRHSYPHCWRTDCALMYRGIKTWFVNVRKIKDLMIAKNQDINWIPKHLKDGRFGKILDGAPDWAISRNRFWGCPIPVWRCIKCEKLEVVNSRKDLEKKCGKKVSDLHKHFVDELSWKCEKCDGKMERIEEVLDCWFESGSMPYASHHFMGETANFQSADFIAEGLDQTRGWFYTLHVLGCGLFGKNIYKNVITNGIVLAEDGQKMSKSKQNYPDPNLIFDKYGADAIRFYLLSSPVVRGENFRFSEKGVEEVLKSVILPLKSSYQFFATYANIDNFKTKTTDLNLENELDAWIISELQTLVKNFREKFDNYEIDYAVNLIPFFIDNLNNWYLRLNRRRFWASGLSEDKKNGYETLYFILQTLSKILAPIMPFFAEKLYLDLEGKLESIHLEKFPEFDKNQINKKLENKVKISREIVSLSAGIRARKKIKLRQPLETLQFFTREKVELDFDILKQETNVKNIKILDEKSLEKFAKKIVLVNAKLVGKKFGKKVQEMIIAGKNGEFEVCKNGIKIVDENLETGEFEFSFLTKEGIEADSSTETVVLLETEITENLRLEGISREIIRAIQEMRKQNGFEVSDRISFFYKTESEILETVLQKFGDKIADECLIEEMISEKITSEISRKIEDEEIFIELKK